MGAPTYPGTRHPLAPLSDAEFRKARDLVLSAHGAHHSALFFRAIQLEEPRKADLIPFLIAEHAGEEMSGFTDRPPRLARVQYDVVTPGKQGSASVFRYTQSVVDLDTSVEISRDEAPDDCHPAYVMSEFAQLQDICLASPHFQDALSEFVIPPHFSIVIDPWPYGGIEETDPSTRYMQGMVFARDDSAAHPDSNHYGYPIPIIPVVEWATKKIIRIDRLATSVSPGTIFAPNRKPSAPPVDIFVGRKPAEYLPELLDRPLREDVKPIDITQPHGPSFTVHDDNLVEWQKWRFRLGFTAREGAVLHDLTYDHRPVLYRLSYSELAIPYADPRYPFHRKQAFDLGDGGVGRAVNNLELGCDCLGAIHYFNTTFPEADGSPTLSKAVVCLHEQDNGICWKHTNFRTGRAVVARLRELVVQFVATLANYDYVFAFKLDVAGGITIETRATGVMSVVAIDPAAKSCQYGAIVAPGVLAQNHQHVFAVRIDPAIDSYAPEDNVVIQEETVPRDIDPVTNPSGNLYAIERRAIRESAGLFAEPRANRVFRLEHATKRNAVSGRRVGYMFVPDAKQLLLAPPGSMQAKRAGFAGRHVWVTGYRDGEHWAAGEFTNQSKAEVGGVVDMVARGDILADEEGGGGEGNGNGTNGTGTGTGTGNGKGKGERCGPVVWGIFGLTHNPRMEDWPVMPVEIHQMRLRPADFFTSNPALDMPSGRNGASVLVGCCEAKKPNGRV
ncbi:related to peroxisomal amine oxidase (copper-containing) [Cephalotrichum gorgonifer]|uniref:Amine oxidase n=1 Tax=Cephalotrichum gorgonifer TaxID=2041049 RepID=A0AAE8MUL9_9PEZI|nr:related to peroxisomal amine oxidase (copper-containing) [Cephalotrichum gorgonifer]